MKKVLSLSFGLTSAFFSQFLRDRFDDLDCVFMDTGAEHPGTYKFARDCNSAFDLNLTAIRLVTSEKLGSGNTYEVLNDVNNLRFNMVAFKRSMKKYGVPYIGGMMCTDRMKVGPHDKYCADKYGKGNFETWLGIRIDEPARFLGADLHRVLNNNFDLDFDDFICIYESVKHDGPSSLRSWFNVIPSEIHNKLFKAARKLHEKMKKSNIMYMAEVCDYEKQDVIDWWDEQDFTLEISEHEGNCVFCPKKSDLKLAAAQRDNPDLYIEWLDAINDESVRTGKGTGSAETMYRGKQRLESVIAKFDGSTGKEIKQRIKGARMYDSGSCSESCEVFSCAI